MRILISGFEAFNDHLSNPTEELIHSLQNNEIQIPNSVILSSVILPVTYADSYLKLQIQIEAFNPDIIISFGLAADREQIDLESTAFNYIDSKTADNNGLIIQDGKVSLNGESAYPSSLPLAGIERILKDSNLPVGISNSAGSYVCNYLFYKMMESNQESMRLCGFIHIPSEEKLSKAQRKLMLEKILFYLTY